MTQQEYEDVRADILTNILAVHGDPMTSKDEANHVEVEWAGLLEDIQEEAFSFGLRLVDDPPIPVPAHDWPYPFVFQERFLRAFSDGGEQ